MLVKKTKIYKGVMFVRLPSIIVKGVNACSKFCLYWSGNNNLEDLGICKLCGKFIKSPYPKPAYYYIPKIYLKSKYIQQYEN